MRAAVRLRLPLVTAVVVVASVCLLSSASPGASAPGATLPYLDPAFAGKLLAIVQDRYEWWNAEKHSGVEDTLGTARLAAVRSSLPDPSIMVGLTIRTDTADSWRYEIYDGSQGETPGDYIVSMGSGLGAVDSTYPSPAYWLYIPDGRISRSYGSASTVVNNGQPIWAAVFTGVGEPPDYTFTQPDLYYNPCGGVNSDGWPNQVGCYGFNTFLPRAWKAVSALEKGTFETWPGYAICNGYSIAPGFGDGPDPASDCSNYGYWKNGIWTPDPITPPTWGARWTDASGIPNNPVKISTPVGAGGVPSNTTSASIGINLKWDLDAARGVIGSDSKAINWVDCQLVIGPTTDLSGCAPPLPTETISWVPRTVPTSSRRPRLHGWTPSTRAPATSTARKPIPRFPARAFPLS